MIVKNESKVILRCLNSVVKYIDTYCICDTGSTDNTQQIITDFFNTHQIKGTLHQHKWKNFGHNRTLAVEAAKGTADYLLLMDADFIFKIINPNFKAKPHTASSMLIKYEGLLDYRQPLMVQGNLDWKYIGVTHEYIHCPGSTRVLSDDFMFQHVGDGANKDDKFERDIKLLTDGIQEEPTNYRYYFYLAQSHKDLAGGLKHTAESKRQIIENLIKHRDSSSSNPDHQIIQSQITQFKGEVADLETRYRYHFGEAIKAYEVRSKQHDFAEEVYYSIYMLGHCHYHLGSGSHIYTGYFLEAYSYRPQRLEALFQLIKYYRLQHKYTIAYDLGRRGADQPYPKTDCLFIDTRIHKYLFKHEVAIAAYYLGHFDDCLRLVTIILEEPDLLESHRKTILEHKRLTELKLLERNKSLVSTPTLSSTSTQLTSSTPTPISTQLASTQFKTKRERPLITFFSYNLLHTGGSEKSDWALLQYLETTYNYQVKHSRDYREIYQDRPDLIVAQQYAIEKGVAIGQELGIPVIVMQHGPSQWGHAIPSSNYFIFNSHHLVNTELPRENFKHYDVIFPRVDIEKFTPSAPTLSKLPEQQQWFITFFGRPVKEKGIDLFIQIAKQMPDHKFLCVGGTKEEVNHLRVEHPLENLTFEEFTLHPEQVYDRTQVLLVPSHNESFGMVTIEASLCGIPVISTDLPGIREATNNRSNYVPTFDDVDQWVSRIREVLNDLPQQQQTALQIGQAYRDRWDDQVEKFRYNLDRLLSNTPPSKFTRTQLTFSIIITVYNRPELVKRAMDSVRAQTYKNWELIVVDDCSTDNTWNELLKYDEEHGDHHKINLIRNPQNNGTFYCRNVGIQASDPHSNNFIINLDSDDILIPTALVRLKDTILKNDANVVQFKYHRDQPNPECIYFNNKNVSNIDQIATDQVYLDHKGTSWGLFCINREYLVNHVGYYDSIRYGADTEFMCRLKNFHKVYNLNQILYYASDAPTGLSHEIKQEWSNQYLRNFFKWYQESKENKTSIYIKFDPDQRRPFPLPDLKSV